MIAYAYNDNGLYVGTVNCQKDPVRSKREGKDIYLLPANATLVAPPEFDSVSQTAIWDGDAWRIEDIPDTDNVSELTPAQLREQAYNTQPVIKWDGSMLTVTQAAQQWAYYAAEGNTAKTDELTALIAEAKASIRARWPDQEV